MFRRLRSMAALLVAGIMVGYICSAVTDFAVAFAENSDIVNLHDWSSGSFSGANWEGMCAAFCMGCDLIARTAFAPTELSISTVTSVFGAPVVIGMMLKRRRAR